MLEHLHKIGHRSQEAVWQASSILDNRKSEREKIVFELNISNLALILIDCLVRSGSALYLPTYLPR